MNKATNTLSDKERKELIKALGLNPSSDKNVKARRLERRLYGDYDKEDFIESGLSNPEGCMKYRDSLVGAWIAIARPRDDSALRDMLLLILQSSKETDKGGESLVNNEKAATPTDQMQTE